MKYLILVVSLMFASNVFAHEGSHESKESKQSCSDYSKYPDVSVDEMQKIVTDSSATILDVNSERSFKKSKIPGAKHFASNEGNLTKVLPKAKSDLIVAYCGGKRCTAWQKAAKAACEMGYTNIKHFSEGIKGWKKINKG